MVIQHEYFNVQQIVVFPDIHADFNKLVAMLTAPKYPDKPLARIDPVTQFIDWVGGKIHLIVMGDCIDGGGRPGRKGVQLPGAEHYCVELLINLKSQAKRSGGEIILLIGNHEYLNTRFDEIGERAFAYASEENMHEYGGVKGRNRAWKPGGAMALKVSTYFQHNVIVNNMLFSHMGYGNKNFSLAQTLVMIEMRANPLKDSFKFIPPEVRAQMLDKGVLPEHIVCRLSREMLILINEICGLYFKGEWGVGIPEFFSEDIFEKTEEIVKVNKCFNVSCQVVGHYPLCKPIITSDIVYSDNMISDAFSCGEGRGCMDRSETVCVKGSITVIGWSKDTGFAPITIA